MKKIMLVLSGLIGIVFSAVGFYVWLSQLLGAGGVIAPELTISQEK